MYNKIVYAIVLCIAIAVSMFIYSLGSQPERVAGSQLSLKLFSGSVVETEGKGVAILSSCSFFEIRNAVGTPIYGVNQSASENCGGGIFTAATIYLEEDDALTVIEGGYVIVATLEASDGYILAAQYPGTTTILLVVFISLVLGILCLIVGIVILIGL